MTTPKNKYRLYCEICNWKRLTDGSDLDDLHEVSNNSSIQKFIPKYDATKKKTIVSENIKRKRKFRCPSCGRVVVAKKLNDDPQAKVDQYWEEIRRQEQAIQWAEEDARFRDEYEQARRIYEEEDQSD